MPMIHFNTVSEVQGATPAQGFVAPTHDADAPDLIQRGKHTRIVYHEYPGQPALWWLYNQNWAPLGTLRVELPRHDDLTALHRDVCTVLNYLGGDQSRVVSGGNQPSRHFEHQGFGRYQESDTVCTLTTRGGSQRDNGLIVCC